MSGIMDILAFRPPAWANDGKRDISAEEAMQRARDLAASYYSLGVQTGIHAMIEWCGVMGEHVKMLEEAVKQGFDPREVDQHRGMSVVVPGFMVEYFCEKLGCQLRPFIHANRTQWRKEIDKWFA